MKEQPWTDSGRQLLDTFNALIRHHGGVEHLAQITEIESQYGYTCKKPECFFCYRTQPHVKLSVSVIRFMLAEGDSLQPTPTFWSDNEIKLLHENIFLYTRDLMPLFPTRTVAAINTMKYKVRLRFGIFARPRERNQYGYV